MKSKAIVFLLLFWIFLLLQIYYLKALFRMIINVILFYVFT